MAIARSRVAAQPAHIRKARMTANALTVDRPNETQDQRLRTLSEFAASFG
jgi:hypothetical protein